MCAPPPPPPLEIVETPVKLSVSMGGGARAGENERSIAIVVSRGYRDGNKEKKVVTTPRGPLLRRRSLDISCLLSSNVDKVCRTHASPSRNTFLRHPASTRPAAAELERIDRAHVSSGVAGVTNCRLVVQRSKKNKTSRKYHLFFIFDRYLFLFDPNA